MSGEFKVKYAHAPDYRKIPATGAWGGLSPNAEVVVNFFVEFLSPPGSTTLHVDDSGAVQREVSGEESEIVRELMIGVVMRPDIARSVGMFLLRYADLAENALAKMRSHEEREGDNS